MPIHPPPHLYKEDTIKRFQKKLQDLLFSKDKTVAKSYLKRKCSPWRVLTAWWHPEARTRCQRASCWGSSTEPGFSIAS